MFWKKKDKKGEKMDCSHCTKKDCENCVQDGGKGFCCQNCCDEYKQAKAENPAHEKKDNVCHYC